MRVRIGLLSCALVIALAAAAGCRPAGAGAASGTAQAQGGGGPQQPPEATPGAGFASDVAVVAVSRDATHPLSVLSLDAATGALGYLPGSPADASVPAGVEARVAVDAANRRLFVASDTGSAIAVLSLDAAGGVAAVPGSPFATQEPGPSAIALGRGGSVLYVGYGATTSLSTYSIDPATGALAPLSGSPASLGGGRGPSSIATSGDLIFLSCYETSEIAVLRADASGAPAGSTVLVRTRSRPVDVDVVGSRLYATLCECNGQPGSIDVFSIDEANASLVRIPGAPFGFASLAGLPHLAANPGGDLLAVTAQSPPHVELFGVQGDGSPLQVAITNLHGGTTGPKRVAWTPDGARLLVADDSLGAGTQGLYSLELAGGTLAPAATPRWRLEGGPVDLAIVGLSVRP